MSALKKFRVLITNKDVPQIAVDLLKPKCEVIILEKFSREECITELLRSDGVLLFGHKLVVDQELIDCIGPKLKVISQMGVGVDHVDVTYVKSKNIKIGNTQETLDHCVAEIAILLALNVAHRTKEGFNQIKKGEWINCQPNWLLGYEIKNSVVGIIGLGNIGKAIATRIKAFCPSKIIYYGRTDKSCATELGAERVSYRKLLQESDFVIVSCPLTDETYHLIDSSSFKIMKKNAILVNISRGDVIKQEDLLLALKEGEIFGAGLDVMTPEPLPQNHPLLELENCIITPHLGSATSQTRNYMAEVAAKNILAALEGEVMPSPI